MGTPTIKIATARSLLAAGNGHGRGTAGTGRKVGLRPNPGPVGPATSRRPLRNYANPPDGQRGRSLALARAYTHTHSRGYSKPLFDISGRSRDPRVPHAVFLRLRAIIEPAFKVEASRDIRTLVRSTRFFPGIPSLSPLSLEDSPIPGIYEKRNRNRVHSRVYSSVFPRG